MEEDNIIYYGERKENNNQENETETELEKKLNRIREKGNKESKREPIIQTEEEI